ncbi:MAG: hypothetical protein J2P23_10155 [Microlunatus sp.]|nr:hypothetical protein [Microlunatus sp.]
MTGSQPDDWRHPELLQTYAPRGAVHVLPRSGLGVFTRGCLPYDAAERAALEADAANICRQLDRRELKGGAVSAAGGRRAGPGGSGCG